LPKLCAGSRAEDGRNAEGHAKGKAGASQKNRYPEGTEIPPLADDERAQLEANIRAEGCRDAIIVWNNSPKALYARGLGFCKSDGCPNRDKQIPIKSWVCGDGIWECPKCGYGVAPINDNIILDGHNRFEICERLKIPYETKDITFDDRLDAKLWIRKNQLARRNLTDDQRAMNAVGIIELETEKAKRDRAKAGRAAGGDATPEQKKERLGAHAASKRKVTKERTRKATAKKTGVSERKIRKGKAGIRNG
jgi:hypothetical protein